jgi:hypothetical protein
MKEYTRDHSNADLAADLAYVRLKSGERPFRPYGEPLALPGVSAALLPSRKIPANEGTTAAHTDMSALNAALSGGPEQAALSAGNVVSLADVRTHRKTPRF